MSKTRCGLQISRDIVITNDTHNHPRSKQMGCLTNGNIIKPDESMITNQVAEEELENQRAISKSEKMDLEELQLSKLSEQGGSGILQTLVNILPVKKIGESVAAGISNLFPDSDKNARDIFPGENHAIVKLPNNKFGRANYTGPGTRIVERLRRGDPPRVLSDKVSQAHDIRYGLARGPNAEDNIRKADLKMLSSLSSLKRNKQDRGININPAMVGIRGKILAENFGLLSRNAFISSDFKPSPAGIAIMENKLKDLEQQGFGAPQYLDPQPGTSATQSLAGVLSSEKRSVALDRRVAINPLKQTFRKDSEVNTRGAFRNRRSDTNLTGSGPVVRSRLNGKLQQKSSEAEFRGGYQVPGMASSSGHQNINIVTGRQRGEGGTPGVNPIQVQTGAGHASRKLPGTSLLKKMNKKVISAKIRSAKNNRRSQFSAARRKPLFLDDFATARIMANQLLPLLA